MHKRRIGPFEVSGIGLGCMSLSHAYGSPPPRAQAEEVLLGALDAGYTFFDKLQPVIRIGSVDPEVGKDEGPLRVVAGDSKTIAPNDEITAYELAVNYYLKKHDAKVQLSGSFFDPEQRESKTTFDLILATQVAF